VTLAHRPAQARRLISKYPKRELNQQNSRMTLQLPRLIQLSKDSKPCSQPTPKISYISTFSLSSIISPILLGFGLSTTRGVKYKEGSPSEETKTGVIIVLLSKQISNGLSFLEIVDPKIN
jgi:hypothetical protein